MLFFALTVAFMAWISPRTEAADHAIYFGRAADARVKILNRSHDHVLVYAIDRWGRWSWAANLNGRSEIVLSSPIDEEWVVTDFRNRPLERARARGGVTTMEIGGQPPDRRPALSTGIKFRNFTGVVVLVYRLNNWGGWEWSGQILPGGELRVASEVGRGWVVATRRGQVLKRAIADNEPTTVEIGR